MSAKHIANIAAGLHLDPSETPPHPASSQSGDCSPDCAVCGGVGYIRYEVPHGHPKFGKLERCPRAQAVAVKNSLQTGEIDPRVGLTADELRDLSWDLVKKGVNQADQACDISRQAYTSGYGVEF